MQGGGGLRCWPEGSTTMGSTNGPVCSMMLNAWMLKAYEAGSPGVGHLRPPVLLHATVLFASRDALNEQVPV